VKVEKLAKIGQKGQNSQPLSPGDRAGGGGTNKEVFGLLLGFSFFAIPIQLQAFEKLRTNLDEYTPKAHSQKVGAHRPLNSSSEALLNTSLLKHTKHWRRPLQSFSRYS